MMIVLHLLIPSVGLCANLACVAFYLVGPVFGLGTFKQPLLALSASAISGIYGAVYFPVGRFPPAISFRWPPNEAHPLIKGIREEPEYSRLSFANIERKSRAQPNNSADRRIGCGELTLHLRF